MNKILITAFSLFVSITAWSQNSIEQVLQEIESNNTTLEALREEMNARTIGNKTGIYLPNPTFEYAWFSGSPSSIGNRNNLSIIQHIDFPTAYLHRSRIADTRNEQLSSEFSNYRLELILRAKQACLELVHTNRRLEQLNLRLDNARKLSDAYTRLLETGETNIIEYNKVKLSYLNLQKETENLIIQKNSLLSRLQTMNGGEEISFSGNAYQTVTLPSDFDQWYENAEQQNPMLTWLKQEIDISRQQVKLQKAENLPGMHGGYVSEALTHEQFRGFSVGITIPLWENKNTTRYAQAHSAALESSQADQKLQYYHTLKSYFAKAGELQSSINEYEQIMLSVDNSDYLNTALEKGEISLTEYLLELSFIYQSIDNILNMELQLHQTIALLNQHLF